MGGRPLWWATGAWRGAADVSGALLRDAEYAIEAGHTVLAAGFRRLLLRAVAIGRRREALKDTTLAHYRADLERRLDRFLGAPEPKQDAARARYDLFRFVT